MKTEEMIAKENVKRAYWRGYDEGRRSSLNHNIILLKGQLKVRRIEKRSKCKYCSNLTDPFFKDSKVCNKCKSKSARKSALSRKRR